MIKHAMQAKSKSEVRSAVKSIFGAKNAKVTNNGEVHVRGMMPNTNRSGWFLFGFTGTAELDDRLWRPDGSLNDDLGGSA